MIWSQKAGSLRISIVFDIMACMCEYNKKERRSQRGGRERALTFISSLFACAWAFQRPTHSLYHEGDAKADEESPLAALSWACARSLRCPQAHYGCLESQAYNSSRERRSLNWWLLQPWQPTSRSGSERMILCTYVYTSTTTRRKTWADNMCAILVRWRWKYRRYSDF